MAKKTDNKALAFMKGEGMSKFKEQFAEYYFLKDLMYEAAANERIVVVSRSDYDAFGYDLLISVQTPDGWKNVKLQLKATGGSASHWDIHKSLLQDKEGRILIIKLHSIDEHISPEYRTFDRKYADIALNTLPKKIGGKINPNKCKVVDTKVSKQFKAITNDLLSLFE